MVTRSSSRCGPSMPNPAGVRGSQLRRDTRSLRRMITLGCSSTVLATDAVGSCSQPIRAAQCGMRRSPGWSRSMRTGTGSGTSRSTAQLARLDGGVSHSVPDSAFAPGARAAFGFNVRRFIRGKNEEDLWQSWGRSQGFYQLLNTGELTGLGALSRSRNVELRPYALGRALAARPRCDRRAAWEREVYGKVGLDAKLGVSADDDRGSHRQTPTSLRSRPTARSST